MQGCQAAPPQAANIKVGGNDRSSPCCRNDSNGACLQILRKVLDSPHSTPWRSCGQIVNLCANSRSFLSLHPCPRCIITGPSCLVPASLTSHTHRQLAQLELAEVEGGGDDLLPPGQVHAAPDGLLGVRRLILGIARVAARVLRQRICCLKSARRPRQRQLCECHRLSYVQCRKASDRMTRSMNQQSSRRVFEFYRSHS